MTDAATVDDQELASAGQAQPAVPAADPAEDAPVDAPAERVGLRQRILKIAKLVFTVVIFVAIGYYLVTNWDAVRAAWETLTWTTMLLSTLAVLLGLAASSMAWRDAVRDIGNPVAFPAAARVFVIGQLGKYVPGTVWVYLLQTELGRRAGVPRARAFLASMTAMAIGIVAALIVGVAALPVLITSSDAGLSYVRPVRIGLLSMIVVLPFALIAIVPRVLTFLVSTALRVLRRPPLEAPLTWAGVLRILAWSIVTWLCYGAHLWLLFDGGVGDGLPAYLRCVGAVAVAVAVAMFFPTPSGVGGREGLLMATMAPFVIGNRQAEIAFGIAWASRMIFFVAELVGAGLAALTDLPGRWGRRRKTTPATEPVDS
ncbi:MAG: flippase-like domain-containing protein [Dactylosporangium sp.]|nr:flippase-like domain-containing protein [Dactylosporangium sp.]NNJ62773.1 flippase-like domain-containing protein [Dactylosporangium sp.]